MDELGDASEQLPFELFVQLWDIQVVSFVEWIGLREGNECVLYTKIGTKRKNYYYPC